MEVERSRHRLRAKRDRFLRLDATDSPPSYRRRCRQDREFSLLVTQPPNLIYKNGCADSSEGSLKFEKTFGKKQQRREKKKERKQGIQNFCAF